MKELIDKAAVIAEIKKRIKKYATIDVGNSRELDALYGAKCKALMEILSFLDTLETKEVDLDKILIGFQNKYAYENSGELPSAIEIAKYFFELGLKAKGEIYVVTRSEEHADYVEAVFLSESKAEEYCKPYNQDENSYARNITEIEIQ